MQLLLRPQTQKHKVCVLSRCFATGLNSSVSKTTGKLTSQHKSSKSSIYIQKYNYHVATILQLCQLKSQLCINSLVVFVELCAQTWPYPVKQRNVVKQVGVGKCNDTESFAELWTPALRESEIKEVIFKNGEQ